MSQEAELRTELIEKIVALIYEKMQKPKAELVSNFARLFLSDVSMEDLTPRHLPDLYGMVLSHWHLINQRKPGIPSIKIYNPNYELDGWQTPHTVVAISADNMPFLVDSVRMELNRYGFTTYFIIHLSMNVVRDKSGQITEIFSSNKRVKGKLLGEAPIYLEISKQTDVALIGQMEKDLERVLADVRMAVEDWQPMVKKAHEVLQDLKVYRIKASKPEIQEIEEFVGWVIHDHFTFLGSQDYVLFQKNGHSFLKVIPQSGLGILREGGTGNPLVGVDLPTQKTSMRGEELVISKSNLQATIHRPAYMDCIAVKRYNAEGEEVGERRFLGLYTSSAYSSRPQFIPILRRKVENVMERSGLPEKGHANKELLNILEQFPRDELFQASEDSLFEITMGILHLQERKQIRLFVRRDVFGRSVSCLVFVPRDRYQTKLRQKFQDILQAEFQGYGIEFTTTFTESILARTLYVIQTDPTLKVEPDLKKLEAKLAEAAKSWQDDLKEALLENFGEEKGTALVDWYDGAFPSSYQEQYTAHTAVFDIKHIETVNEKNPLGIILYRPLEAQENELHLKLFRMGAQITLSDVLPMLENMGLRVLSEHPYEIKLKWASLAKSGIIWLQDFGMDLAGAKELNPNEIKDIFQDAFVHIWQGDAENDGFNRLVLAAHLNWRETSMLRAYAKYLRQVGFTFSQVYIESALSHHPKIVSLLVKLFYAKFDPRGERKTGNGSVTFVHSILDSLRMVSNLDEDRIFRRYLEIIQATLRTNFFQVDTAGQPKSYISFKLDCAKVPDLPLPKPLYEIFVYSPRVEGVHLRVGKIARGGIRWSDRREDFRTEVLGLVKAQQVKNAVIVPVGAKGGFFPKCLPASGARDEVMKEVVVCYSTFIRGLLDITDNLKAGQVVAPEDVVHDDGEDPYLVVAADKGTASFSDIANGIAAEYGFWLGDAFASGGGQGYDHKKIGITAKGAWESVKRYFRDLGIDVQKQAFTVIGIGDMAGDVFGNGLLLSKQLRLVAAFNHAHIFLDPDPEAEVSYKERERLFNLPRSTWEDYNPALISKGGGVYKRTLKSIVLSEEVKRRLELDSESLEPNELIRAILRAKVDLLWNGGIGTYVKASKETHAEVGDRSNDGLRINGNELRCRVVAEGGNLGFTQLGRVEYALNGGLLHTDFIDNSAGVDCSDHEVNAKILLNELVSQGDLTLKQRNQILKEMTENIALLVLKNNTKQTQALAIAARRAKVRLDDHTRLIQNLEREGKLNRALEGLPTDEELMNRKLSGTALTPPELAVLLAYSKNVLQHEIMESRLPEDPYFVTFLKSAFPSILSTSFLPAMQKHRLRREIIATQLSNSIVNEMGATFLQRLKDETGASSELVIRSVTIARAVFDVPGLWQKIEDLDNTASTEVQITLFLEIIRLVRRATRWFVRNYRKDFDISGTIQYFVSPIHQLVDALETLLPTEDLQQLTIHAESYEKFNVPLNLAKRMAGLPMLFSGLDIIQAALAANVDVLEMAKLHFSLGDVLRLQWFRDKIANYPVSNHWESVAAAVFRDDLDTHQSGLALEVFRMAFPETMREDRIACWSEENKKFLEQWHKMFLEAKPSATPAFAMFVVAIRELHDLVHTSRYRVKQQEA
ncbi:MAG: NAD-glutamate dehydrogenase [Gammaproteobacteria bacterium]|nr:NAD-glutamate dehydrogenase [Gammaproteobacteria bacterium]